MNRLRFIFTLLLLLVMGTGLRAQDQAPEPIVILISIDGCRWDYVQKYRAPALAGLAQNGVRAERMLSCFPSKTFPNHYSIVTGLRPENHGIIGNEMYDPAFAEMFTLSNGGPRESKWWAGEPIWVTATKAGLRSACMFWPGSEARIAGHRPDIWRPYEWRMTSSARVQAVLEWLKLPAKERPALITLYFDIVDGAGHDFGPDSPETGNAVAKVDEALAELIAGVDSLGLVGQVNYIVTSDHGMTPISTQRRIVLDDYVDPTTVRIDFDGTNVGLRPLDGNVEHLYAKFAGAHPHFTAYRREDIPERLHFSHNLRIPPVVLVADAGWLIYTRADYAIQDQKEWGNGGTHGYDPSIPDMGATFIASGPAIQNGKLIAPFENIHVYDLICSLLKLPPAPNDGDHRLAYQVLKP